MAQAAKIGNPTKKKIHRVLNFRRRTTTMTTWIKFPMPNNHLSFMKSISFWLICSSFPISFGVEQSSKPHYHVVNVSSLLPKPYCTGHTKGSSLGSQKIAVRSRNGPCSSISDTNELSAYDDEALSRDEARVRSLNLRKDSKFYSKADELGSRLQVSHPFSIGGEYLVNIGLGTPKMDYAVMMDTGSDQTWVRCKPCSKGCKSKNPLFDPSMSSSYSNGSCKLYNNRNDFYSNYGDETYSRGHWGCDKLSLEPSDVFEQFQFGCGQNNFGGNDNFGNGAGILGLGRGDLSLVSQTASKFGKVFSYCLPKTSSSLGYLEFGDRARSKTSSSGLKFTNLINLPSQNIPSTYYPKSLYFLELTGISVAGIRLNVSPRMFTSTATVIDSGTVVTYLPQEVYIALKTMFKQSMAEYPSASPQENLDTCYNMKGYSDRSILLPEIGFQFGKGMGMSLNPSGIVWIPKKNPYIWCLGFAAKKFPNDLTIIGNHLQREIDILYDIQGGKIGFGTKPCGD